MRQGSIAILILFVSLLWGGAACAQNTRLAAQQAPNPYERANAHTVGIITGSLNSTAMSIAHDLARALNSESLRIVPILGEGSIQNIEDLLYLKGIDIGIVQSDVLSFLVKQGQNPAIDRHIQYISRLYTEEFHLLSQMKYLCIDELKGRIVNFGPKGSGSAITAQAIFKAHEVTVKAVYLDQDVALQKLRNGEIDATAVVSGKPSRFFDHIRYTDRVHFLDVTYVPGLRSNYLPAILTHKDYPDLVARKEIVSTVAVSAVMAVYNWKPDTVRYAKVSQFVDAYFNYFNKLKSPLYHPKWREVDLRAPVGGWDRFPAAQAWLNAHPAPASASNPFVSGAAAPANAAQSGTAASNIQEQFKRFLESQGASAANVSQEQLFKQFVRWYQQRGQRQ